MAWAGWKGSDRAHSHRAWRTTCLGHLSVASCFRISKIGPRRFFQVSSFLGSWAEKFHRAEGFLRDTKQDLQTFVGFVFNFSAADESGSSFSPCKVLPASLHQLQECNWGPGLSFLLRA